MECTFRWNVHKRTKKCVFWERCRLLIENQNYRKWSSFYRKLVFYVDRGHTETCFLLLWAFFSLRMDLNFFLTFLYDPFTVRNGQINLEVNLEVEVDLEEVWVNGYRRRTRKGIRPWVKLGRPERFLQRRYMFWTLTNPTPLQISLLWAIWRMLS